MREDADRKFDFIIGDACEASRGPDEEISKSIFGDSRQALERSGAVPDADRVCIDSLNVRLVFAGLKTIRC